MTAQPRALNPTMLALWEQHREDKPVLTLICGAGDRRCVKILGRVWATPAGLLLHYSQHVAPRRFDVDASALTAEQLETYLAREDNALRRYEPGQKTGIATGLRDDDGWLAMVDDAFYWHPADVGCLTHDGFVPLDRERLLAAAMQAIRKGRRADYRVRG